MNLLAFPSMGIENVNFDGDSSNGARIASKYPAIFSDILLQNILGRGDREISSWKHTQQSTLCLFSKFVELAFSKLHPDKYTVLWL